MTPALKLVVRGLLASGNEFRNIFYYTTESEFTESLVAVWAASLYGTLSAVWPTGYSIYGVDIAVRLLASEDTDPLGWGASTFTGATVNGAIGTQNLPPADCMIVIGQTGVKHVMAKKFLAGISEDHQNNGVLDGTVMTALNNFGAYWRTPTNAPAGGAVIACSWGPTHGFVPILSTRSDSRVFHLQRRQVGRGI